MLCMQNKTKVPLRGLPQSGLSADAARTAEGEGRVTGLRLWLFEAQWGSPWWGGRRSFLPEFGLEGDLVDHLVGDGNGLNHPLVGRFIFRINIHKAIVEGRHLNLALRQSG